MAEVGINILIMAIWLFLFYKWITMPYEQHGHHIVEKGNPLTDLIDLIKEHRNIKN